MDYVLLKDKRYLYAIESNRIINLGIKDLFLKHGSSKKIEWDEVKLDEDTIKSRVRNLNQITFEISQNCNLNCLYCIYGGSYYYQRRMASKSISFKTAQKTIEYIYGFIKNRPKKEIIIGFYGGEPLLKFEVIKKIVYYCKQVLSDWQLRFTITTNGTLLNDRIIHYLIENRFDIMLSLDGNQKIHDSKRIFVDGTGTYHKIIENLKNLKRINNEYYRKKVFFMVTYSKDLPFAEIINFFNSNSLVKTNSITLNFVNHLDTDYFNRFPHNVLEVNSAINKIVKALVIKKTNNLSLSPIEDEIFHRIGDMEKRTRRRQISYLAESCLFDKRLYIDVDGRFHICEKMNHRFSFGDCHKGFDFKRMMEIAQEFINLVKMECRDCKARFLCSRCYIHFAKNGEFKINPEFCENNKNFIKSLERIIELKERGILL